MSGGLAVQSHLTSLFLSRAGTIHNDTPNGTEDAIHGLQTYVASGDSMKGVIVIIPDVFGWVLPNVRLLADGFARKTGLTVYVPDFMSGECILMKQIPSGAYPATPRHASLGKKSKEKKIKKRKLLANIGSCLR